MTMLVFVHQVGCELLYDKEKEATAVIGAGDDVPTTEVARNKKDEAVFAYHF